MSRATSITGVQEVPSKRRRGVLRLMGEARAAHFWRPFGASFANSLAIQFLGIATGVALARSLGLHDRGALAAVMLWPAMYSTLGGLGLADAVTYAVVKSPSRVRTIAGTGLAVAALQSIVLLSIGVGLAPVTLGQYRGGIVWWGALAMTQIPLTLASQVLTSVLNGLQRYGRFQVARSAFVVLAGAAILVLWLAGRLGIGSAVIVYVSANVVTTAIIAVLVAREGALGLRAERAIARELAVYGLKSHVGILSSTLNQRLDQLVISLVLAPRELGLYVVAVSVGGSISMLGSSIAQITLPQIGGSRSPRERSHLVRVLVAVTAATSLFAAALFALVARPLIVLGFGAAFAGAATSARILLVAGAFLGLNAVLAGVLKGLGRPLHAGLGELVALGLTAVSLAVLLPLFGIAGAALASLVAYLTSTLWMLRRCASEIRPSLGEAP